MQAIFTFLYGYIHFATTYNRNKNDGVVYVKADICVDCNQVSLGQTTGLLLNFKYNKQLQFIRNQQEPLYWPWPLFEPNIYFRRGHQHRYS